MNIGEMLRTARQEKNVSVVDVSNATRISKKYIQALEDNNFQVIPSQVFAKGFLKAYCDYLGVDKKSLLDELASHYKGKEVVGRSLSPAVEAVEGKSQTNKMQLYVIYGLLGLFLISIIVFEYISFVPARKQAPVKQEPAPAVIKPVSPQKPGPIQRSITKDLVEIKLIAIKESLVKVESDGKVVYDRIMTKGDSEIFSGGFIRVIAGKGAGVRLFRDGRDYGVMGDESNTVEHSYVAQNK